MPNDRMKNINHSDKLVFFAHYGFIKCIYSCDLEDIKF